jgi:hypothetical protein
MAWSRSHENFTSVLVTALPSGNFAFGSRLKVNCVWSSLPCQLVASLAERLVIGLVESDGSRNRGHEDLAVSQEGARGRVDVHAGR